MLENFVNKEEKEKLLNHQISMVKKRNEIIYPTIAELKHKQFIREANQKRNQKMKF